MSVDNGRAGIDERPVQLTDIRGRPGRILNSGVDGDNDGIRRRAKIADGTIDPRTEFGNPWRVRPRDAKLGLTTAYNSYFFSTLLSNN